MQVEELFRLLRPVRGREMDELWRLYHADPGSREAIEAHLHELASRQLGLDYRDRRLLLEPPPRELAGGELGLGEVLYGREDLWPFGLRDGELLQHVAVFGRSGAGKTNAGLVLLQHLLRRGIPFLVLDWKRTYRELLASEAGRGLLVLTAGREVAPFGFNPIRGPPGSDPENWVKKLTDVLCRAYQLGEGAAYLLQRGLLEVAGRPGGTWADLAAWLDAAPAKGREAQWLASARRAVAGLCVGSAGRVVNVARAPDPAGLLARPVVLELDALSSAEKLFLVGALLLWIHQYRLSEPGREVLKHVIVLEEAHHLLSQSKLREGMPELLMREIRELGEGMVILDQHPSLVSLPSLGNTYCTIALNQKHQRDVAAVAHALLLPEADRPLLGRLGVGEAVVKLQGRWPKPFAVRLRPSGLSKGKVDDAWVRRQFEGLAGSSEGSVAPRGQEKEILPIRQAEGPSGPDAILLSDVAAVPFAALSERLARTGLSAWAGERAARSLVRAGLVESGTVRLPWGRQRVLRLTASGREEAARRGWAVAEPPARGGLEHEFWKHRVAEALGAAGLAAGTEKWVGGHLADLVVAVGGRTVVVEVETGESDWVGNVERSLSAGAAGVAVVATSKPTAFAIGRRAAERWPGRVEVVGVADLKCLPDTVSRLAGSRTSTAGAFGGEPDPSAHSWTLKCGLHGDEGRRRARQRFRVAPSGVLSG